MADEISSISTIKKVLHASPIVVIAKEDCHGTIIVALAPPFNNKNIFQEYTLNHFMSKVLNLTWSDHMYGHG